MKSHRSISTSVVLGLSIFSTLLAEEKPGSEIVGLQKAAGDFVAAYNKRDADALAKLFTDDGEITNMTGAELTSGHEQIKARYEEIFAGNSLQIAIEVDSVRFVAPNLAIEDGTYHLSPADDEMAPPKSTAYTAVLMKTDGGEWRIASSRSLKDVTGAAGHLAALADAINGEWTHRDAEGVRLDLAIGWDTTGTYLSGEMLTTTADAEPQGGNIRISWDAAKKEIVSWMFDAKGGFTHGIWTPADDGWLIRSEGTTADGEILTASQRLIIEGNDTLIWEATRRVIDGVSIPDKSLRIVRQAPQPSED